MTEMADTMTACLQAHAEQVCRAVLGAGAESVTVSAHLSTEKLPGHISATHEYMIVIDFKHAPELLPDATKRLISFLGKNVIVQGDDTQSRIYWGEGDLLSGHTLSPTPASDMLPKCAHDVQTPYQTIEWMKSDTILPNWLDSILFDSLGARHEPNWQRYEHNLDLNEKEIQVYLGTYFPRGYAEAFCILDELLEHPVYSAVWANKKKSSLLDVGTGTGGNLIGILTALAKHCPHLKQVTVHGFDGNSLALDATRAIITSLKSHVSFELDVRLEERLITSLNDLPVPARDSYDFITTFKMGGEIISRGGGLADNFYHSFLSKYSKLLSDVGLILLLDVTTKPGHSDFLPQLLNEQISRFVREQGQMTTLIPVPCYVYEAQCTEPCFTQKEFSVSHRSASKDKSRVSYRVLTRASFAQAFHEFCDITANYIICAKQASGTFNICTHSAGRGALLDSYRIGK